MALWRWDTTKSALLTMSTVRFSMALWRWDTTKSALLTMSTVRFSMALWRWDTTKSALLTMSTVRFSMALWRWDTTNSALLTMSTVRSSLQASLPYCWGCFLFAKDRADFLWLCVWFSHSGDAAFRKWRWSSVYLYREGLYRGKVLLSNAFHFVEWALFKDIGSV